MAGLADGLGIDSAFRDFVLAEIARILGELRAGFPSIAESLAVQLQKVVDAWPDVQIMGDPMATLPAERVQQIAREYRDLWELSENTGLDGRAAK